MKKVILLLITFWAFSSLMAQSFETLQSEKGVTSFRGQDPATVVFKKHPAQPSTAKSALNEGFEGISFPPAGWATLDVDGDGEGYYLYNIGSAHSGVNSATSASWTSAAGPLTPDNHLITPALIPATGDTLSFWYAAQDPAYPSDKFQVLVSTTGKAAANFTDTLWVKTITDSTWTQKKLSLAAYVGDTIFVSFNHFDCTDWYQWKLDDVMGPAIYYAPDLAVTDIAEPMSSCGLGNEDVTIEVTNNSDVAISLFSLAFKVDNGSYVTETYTGTAIPAFGSINYTFTAKANLSALGAHTLYAKVIYTGDNDASNDEMMATVENFNGKTIPYKMGFETGESLAGWNVIDVAGDGSTWFTIENGVNPYNGTGYVYCTSPSSDDWLITPCLDLQTGVQYEVSAWTKTKVGGNETFSIMIGQSPDAAGLTTKLKDVTVVADAYDLVKQEFTVTTAGLYYIGFHANSTASAMTVYIDDIMIDDLFTGINNANASAKISMYPNPAENNVNFRSTEAISQIKIVNVIGQSVLVYNPDTKQFTMDVSNLESGIYFVTIETAGKTTVKKLTVKK